MVEKEQKPMTHGGENSSYKLRGGEEGGDLTYRSPVSSLNPGLSKRPVKRWRRG